MADYPSSPNPRVSMISKRPQVPMGPRTRTKSSLFTQDPSSRSRASLANIRPISAAPPRPPYMPEFGPGTPEHHSTPLGSIHEPELLIEEEEPSQPPPPTPPTPTVHTLADEHASSSGHQQPTDDLSEHSLPSGGTLQIQPELPLVLSALPSQGELLATSPVPALQPELESLPLEQPRDQQPTEQPTDQTTTQPSNQAISLAQPISPPEQTTKQLDTPTEQPDAEPTLSSAPPSAPSTLRLSNATVLESTGDTLDASSSPVPPSSTLFNGTPSITSAFSLSPDQRMTTTPKLTRPPAIKFENPPVQWKGLPLEAAMWTFDSKELQAIVSRAIRSSAKESYIRLLAIDILDNVLPAEVERLEGQRTMTQAKYRFLVHRRTMQLQALLSSSLAPRPAKEADDGVFTATRLVVQISETTAECDQLMEELLRISDQLSQIRRLLDHHWASSLAIALRKLNGSYARRTQDLVSAKERIEQLQAELEDAWAEAQKLAEEMDDLDGDLSDAELDEAVIERVQRVCVTPGTDSRPMSPTILTVRGSASSSPTTDKGNYPGSSSGVLSNAAFQPRLYDRVDPLAASSSTGARLSPHRSPLSPLLVKGGVPKRQSAGTDTPVDVPDSVSIKSSRSIKSTRSWRSGVGRDTRAAIVSAAKKRSSRASQSSLRLPPSYNAHGHRQSRPKTPYDTENQPPVPSLPSHLASSSITPRSASARTSSTAFHFEPKFGANPRLTLDSFHATSSTIYRRASVDSAIVTTGHHHHHHQQHSAAHSALWNGTRDDMYFKPTTAPLTQMSFYDSSVASGSGSGDQESDIQIVMRTPPSAGRGSPQMIPMDAYSARLRPQHQQPHPRSVSARVDSPSGKNIPSMWTNVDGAPKAPAEQMPDAVPRPGAKGKPIQRLKGLTKRYSISFPLFSSRVNRSASTLGTGTAASSG